jgi:hypothetical protein
VSASDPIGPSGGVRIAGQSAFGRKGLVLAIGVLFLLSLLVGCAAPPDMGTPTLAGSSSPSASAPGPAAPSTTSTPISSSPPTCGDGSETLSETELTTLSSLEQVDDYPLYLMAYAGNYEARLPSAYDAGLLASDRSPALTMESMCSGWSCALFAALGDPAERLYGRNFDWEFSPALLLLTDPPDGYASVSMVDITFLGIDSEQLAHLMDASVADRCRLLYAPFLPFDGLNERGLAIGMAAVPPGAIPPDPAKETVGSVEVIRLILDHAASVDEAVAILGDHNIDMEGGPPIHYLVADSSGRSALVEFYQGQMVVIPNQGPWQAATNFLLASAGDSPAGSCWRFDRISQVLTEAQGRLSQPAAFDLLEDVSQGSTQWSVVYGMTSGDIEVVMGQEYADRHTFHLTMAGE